MDADMKKPRNLSGVLKKNGWNCRMPSLLIMEGVSYYLDKKELLALINLFKKNGENHILLEYLLPLPFFFSTPLRFLGFFMSASIQCLSLIHISEPTRPY